MKNTVFRVYEIRYSGIMSFDNDLGWNQRSDNLVGKLCYLTYESAKLKCMLLTQFHFSFINPFFNVGRH